MTRSVKASKVGARTAATGKFTCAACGVVKGYSAHKRPTTCLDCRSAKTFEAPRRTS